jgi:hypothetical protein
MTTWNRFAIACTKYLFVPLSLGCEIAVEEIATGAQTHLLTDVGGNT